MSAPPAAVIAVMEADADGQVKDAKLWRVLVAIASFADADGGNAWPSLASIGRRANTPQRTTQRYIDRLVEDGHLTVEYKAGPRGCNVYTVEAARRAAALDARVDVATHGSAENLAAHELAEYVATPSVATSETSRRAHGQIEHPPGHSSDGTWPNQGGDVANMGGHQPDHPYEPGPPPAPAPTREADGDRLASMLTRRGIDRDDSRVADALAEHGPRQVARAALLSEAFDDGDAVAALLGGLAFEARREAGASHEDAEAAGIAAAREARPPVAEGARA